MDAITSHVPDYDNCGHDSCSLPRRRPFERMTKRQFKNNRRQLPRQIHSTSARGDPPSAPQLEKRTGLWNGLEFLFLFVFQYLETFFTYPEEVVRTAFPLTKRSSNKPVLPLVSENPGIIFIFLTTS